MLRPAAVLAVLLLACATSWAQSVYVKDGDDIVINGQDYRLEGVDAFERGQSCRASDSRQYDCGAAAKAALEKIVGDRSVSCHWTGKRSGDRLIANCQLDGLDLEELLVASGWALVRPDFLSSEKGARLCSIERDAAAARRGAWAGSFELPYFQKGGRKKSRQQVSCSGR